MRFYNLLSFLFSRQVSSFPDTIKLGLVKFTFSLTAAHYRQFFDLTGVTENRISSKDNRSSVTPEAVYGDHI